MTVGPFLWWLLTMACVAWYATVTMHVAIRGIGDIRKMLARLKENQPNNGQEPL
jgi:hypothetical protein